MLSPGRGRNGVLQPNGPFFFLCALMLRKFLPQTNIITLRIVVVSTCLLYMAEFTYWLRNISSSPIPSIILAFGFWVPLAVGLWLLKYVARMVALGFHWLLFFLIPFGILNPYAALDHAWGTTPEWELFLIVVALGTANCYVIYILDKHKDQFTEMRQKARPSTIPALRCNICQCLNLDSATSCYNCGSNDFRPDECNIEPGQSIDWVPFVIIGLPAMLLIALVIYGMVRVSITGG